MHRLILGTTSFLLCTAAMPAGATVITGAFYVVGNPTNFFDASQGFVPAGYGNSGGSTAVTVGSGVEFAEQDPFNTITADFTATGLVLTDVTQIDAGNYSFVFTADTAGFFANLTKSSDSFFNLTYSLNGNTLTINTQRITVPMTRSVSFSFANAAAVPEVESWAMLIGGLTIIGLSMRRRRRVAVRFA